MLSAYPLSWRMLIFIIIPCVVGGLYLLNDLNNSLPVTTGQIQLNELSAPVNVKTDEHGVTYIDAKYDQDAFMALGFTHAQERLWQMEMQKRIAQGRLSELFGKGSVGVDIMFRTLGLYPSAKEAYKYLGVEAQASLQAYAKGVNGWLALNKQLPIEFSIVDVKPQPWTVYDSLAWLKVFSLNLSGNYKQEINRMVASGALNKQQLQTFFHHYPKDGPFTVQIPGQHTSEKLEQLSQIAAKVESDFSIGGRYVGSNAWVVAAKHSATGNAIIANDPHLGLQIPSFWYASALKGDKINVSGMTLVGLPLVIFGKNEQVAWGGTNMMADVQDLYFEQQNKQNPAVYNVDGQWQAFDTRIESIKIHAEFPELLQPELKPVEIEVRHSRHGPIISDLVNLKTDAVALKWTALDPKDTSYEAFFGLNYATDWSSFRTALSFHVSPALNLLYADTSGNIGFQAAGKIPIRQSGQGMFPVMGEQGNQWTGYIPFDQLPHRFNPPKGFIVSANNKIVDDSYPYFISADWALPIRAKRITKLLEQGIKDHKKLTVEDMKTIQADTFDASFAKILPIIMRHKPNNTMQVTAYKFLTQWDGDMSRDSQAAAIFNAWLIKLRSRLFRDELTGYWNKPNESRVLRGLISNVSVDKLIEIIADDKLGWCNDKTTSEVEDCALMIDIALDDALRSNYRFAGDDSMQSWTWGSMHPTVYKHNPFSDTKVLNRFFEKRIGNGGSSNSINVANGNFRASGGYEQNFGAGFRMIIDMAKTNASLLYMNSTGQSGNVWSDHYDDMIEPFRELQYFTLEEPKDANTLHLLP